MKRKIMLVLTGAAGVALLAAPAAAQSVLSVRIGSGGYAYGSPYGYSYGSPYGYSYRSPYGNGYGAYGYGQHEREHEDLDDEHADDHDDLDRLHAEAHEQGLTRRQHRRLHRYLERQHAYEHYELDQEHAREHQEDNYYGYYPR